ncbi:MAG: hypothetical protein WB630_07330 [Candidatus Acidiferrales bacterium]
MLAEGLVIAGAGFADRSFLGFLFEFGLPFDVLFAFLLFCPAIQLCIVGVELRAPKHVGVQERVFLAHVFGPGGNLLGILFCELFDSLVFVVAEFLQAVGFILRRLVLASLCLVLGVFLPFGFLVRCEVLLFGKIVRHSGRRAAGGKRRWSSGRIIRRVFRLQWPRGRWRLRFRSAGRARFGLFPDRIGVADGLLDAKKLEKAIDKMFRKFPATLS